MTKRIFVVGTDTNAGKTTVTCALLESAKRNKIAAVPFKPAETGPSGPTSDSGRLLAASILDENDARDLSPHRFARPIAPGVAEDLDHFTGKAPAVSDFEARLGQARWALARLEQRHFAQVSLIEGAGGLMVPMPGGSWLPEWISGLRAQPLITARAGLGTINHTLLTIESLRIRELEPIGFIFTQLLKRDDPSRSHNAAVIETRSGVPCLGSLPFLGRPNVLPTDDDWLAEAFWTRVLAE